LTSGDPGGDWDLVVDTMNRAGAQTVTRRFRVAPGTTDVTLRYRFQSDEHRIGQLTGSYADDWYEVKVRAVGAGAQAQDVQTVSTLWNQFDSNHATPWFTLRLPVTVPGDTVEVTLTAANAVDNAYLGLLYADIVQEVITQVSELTLNDMHASRGGSRTCATLRSGGTADDFRSALLGVHGPGPGVVAVGQLPGEEHVQEVFAGAVEERVHRRQGGARAPGGCRHHRCAHRPLPRHAVGSLQSAEQDARAV
jgi:hypothetical protein